ncbi:MAG: hypothetical protein ACNA8W_03585 [Bradymonadaceae bacterium]
MALSERQIQAIVEAVSTAEPLRPLERPRERRPCRVLESHLEGPRYRALRLEIPPSYREAHERPAQYVTLKTTHSEPRFFVIANAPGEPHWDFLIERISEFGPLFDALECEHSLLVSPPEGTGFDLGAALGKTVHLFATGSGIATMRPLIQHWLANPDLAPRQTNLYYGESAPEDFAYTDELEAWRDEGILVYQALGHGPTQAFPYQFVQHAFEARSSSIGSSSNDEALVYISGAPIMMEVIADKMLRLGLPPQRLITNL